MKNILRRIKLNWNILNLILTNRFLSHADVAKSYNAISRFYDKNWLCHLHSVTDTLLNNIPENNYTRILDLGCGTGYTVIESIKRYPGANIVALDISEGMLKMAQSKTARSKNIDFICADILPFIKNQADNSYDLVISAWAIGYSNPNQIIQEAYRIVRPDGIFAFVVNYMETLKPIFTAFRYTMRRFPDQVSKVVIPRFPKNWHEIEKKMKHSQFSILFHKDGKQNIKEYTRKNESVLPWLLNTGILAGFDKTIPLHENKEVQHYFENVLKKINSPLTHDYVIAIGKKR